ncbi:unnamed protein product [Musa banksii]
MDFSQAVLDPSANGAAPNPGKRGREIGVPVAMALPQQNRSIDLLSLQPQPPLPPPALVRFAQLQSHPPAVVSTGLRLSPEEGLLSTFSTSFLSSIFSEELAAHLNQQKGEIEQFLCAQRDQLRRALAQKWRRHYRSLIGAAAELAAQRLREKAAAVGRLTRRIIELEDHLARLRTESMAWQAKAMADQATAASLEAQLQQAAAAAASRAQGGPCGESIPAEDAESVYVDPDRVEMKRACRACRARLASVVLLPCRHLCLCDACDGGESPAESCPVCGCVTTGGIRVLLG